MDKLLIFDRISGGRKCRDLVDYKITKIYPSNLLAADKIMHLTVESAHNCLENLKNLCGSGTFLN